MFLANVVDIVVVILVILLVLLVVFFRFILPTIKRKKVERHSRGNNTGGKCH